MTPSSRPPLWWLVDVSILALVSLGAVSGVVLCYLQLPLLVELAGQELISVTLPQKNSCPGSGQALCL